MSNTIWIGLLIKMEVSFRAISHRETVRRGWRDGEQVDSAEKDFFGDPIHDDRFKQLEYTCEG